MGGLLSYLWGPSTVPDPTTGLSLQDKHLVAYSWGVARRNAKETGLHLFQKLFQTRPDIKDMFPFGRGKDWDQMTSDARLLAHINSVLYALTSFVDNINDVPVLEAMLRKTADNHARRKITVKEFEILGVVLLQTLTEKLGPRVMNMETTEAWKKVYALVLKIIGDQMSKDSSE